MQEKTVHLVVKKIMEKYDKNVSYGIAQAAHYARTFFECGPERDYSAAKDFSANIVLMFWGANVPKTYDTMENPPKTFDRAYEDMRNFLSSEKTAVYHSMGFYIRPILDEAKMKVSEKYGDTFIDISDIRSLPEAHGLFNHPGDLGMKLFADRFFEAIEQDVKRICEAKN